MNISQGNSAVSLDNPTGILRALRMMLERLRLAAKDCGVWPGEPASLGTDHREFDDLWAWLVGIGSACAKLPKDHFVNQYGYEWWSVESDRVIERLQELVALVRTEWGAPELEPSSASGGTREPAYFCVPAGARLPSQTYMAVFAKRDEVEIIDVIARPLDAQQAFTIERCIARLLITAPEAQRAVEDDSQDAPIPLGRPPDPMTSQMAAFIHAQREAEVPWSELPELVLNEFGRKLSEATIKRYFHRFKASS